MQRSRLVGGSFPSRWNETSASKNYPNEIHGSSERLHVYCLRFPTFCFWFLVDLLACGPSVVGRAGAVRL